jgi:hypothetical protein
MLNSIRPAIPVGLILASGEYRPRKADRGVEVEERSRPHWIDFDVASLSRMAIRGRRITSAETVRRKVLLRRGERKRLDQKIMATTTARLLTVFEKGFVFLVFRSDPSDRALTLQAYEQPY